MLAAWYLIRDRLRGFGFYALFAFAVTASVQLVGIYLVFASLIIPALATRRIESRRRRIACGYLVGGIGCLLGLVISLASDLPAGAVMVWSLAAVALVFAWSWRALRRESRPTTGVRPS